MSGATKGYFRWTGYQTTELRRGDTWRNEGESCTTNRSIGVFLGLGYTIWVGILECTRRRWQTRQEQASTRIYIFFNKPNTVQSFCFLL